MKARRTIREEKTLDVEVEVEGGVIKHVEISGDFFAYPSEAVEELEEALKGCGSVDCINSVFEKLRGVLLVGVKLGSLREAVISVFTSLTSESYPGESK
ncbi:MAG: ABC transporter substrate-binding protein [Desulfurococcus sp.]|nr:ABC transporter substrate-binding protein [Desulfurococcus sp.]